ncbi:GAF domain-containing protein [Myxococcota bacterium]|nr:GAF domain-containing protein [Myxococcota bacterium]MCZ7617775.1 ATP-binding protein [Myxococcota bacterium]
MTGLPLPGLRFRRASLWLAIAWAAFALFAFLRATLFGTGYTIPFHTSTSSGRVSITWVTEEGSAAGVRPGDRLQAIDGIPYLRWGREGHWRGIRAGTPNQYQFRRPDGSSYPVMLHPVPAPAGPVALIPIYLASFAVGVTYLVLGLLVWLLRRDREESWAFAVFCAAMAAQLFVSFDTYRQTYGYERNAANFGVLAAATFQLFTSYPFEPRWVVKRPWLRRLPWAVALLALPLIWLEGSPRLPYFAVQNVGFFFVSAMALFCCGVLLVERTRRRGEAIADRADVMLFGALVSFVPVVLLLLIDGIIATGFPVYLAMLWFVVFPICVSYGIVRRQLFDIRHLARSSVAYGAATLAITGAYAFLIALADAALVKLRLDARSPRFTMLFLFVAILAFNPLRNRVQRVVDRVFDRDQGRYRQTVREISEAMVSMLSIQEIVERIVRALSEAMAVERSMVLLLTDDDRKLRAEATGGSWPAGSEAFALSMDHPVCKYLWMRREDVSREDVEEETDPQMREPCLAVFDELDLALLVPILFGVDLLGVIAVGRKGSGDRFGPDDRQLLLTLANQSSIAIENARAFDEIAKLNETLEARVEERTQELRETQALLVQSEKMRTLGQLVAGVAHELNNPIGFVHANLKLLEEYVAKLTALQERGGDVSRVREAIRKLLSRSREGTQRVKQIVADLRTFSRMDQAELQEADLNQEIDRTLSLMEPRARSGIEIERDFGDLPRVRCHAGQLNQVFMNLLINACDAMGDKGRIRVRTRALDETRVRLEFEDEGPGIPPEVRDRVFEPFFTTKAVGQGTGLGLSLSHGIIERHGGRIWVESEAGAGTRFVVELPIRAIEIPSPAA